MGLPAHLKAVASTAFNTVIAATCPCKAVTELKVRTDGLYVWRIGTAIQHALPELTTEQRELLITGLCQPCSDGMYAHLEDEYDDIPEPRLTESGGQA